MTSPELKSDVPEITMESPEHRMGIIARRCLRDSGADLTQAGAESSFTSPVFSYWVRLSLKV